MSSLATRIWEMKTWRGWSDEWYVWDNTSTSTNQSIYLVQPPLPDDYWLCYEGAGRNLHIIMSFQSIDPGVYSDFHALGFG